MLDCTLMFLLAMLTLLAWLLVKPKTVDLDVKVCAFLDNGECGQNTSKLKEVYNKYSKDSNKSVSSLIQALQLGCEKIDASITYKQASQIIKAWTHLTDVKILTGITFGEFCLCALECKAFSICRRVPPSFQTNNHKGKFTKMVRSVFLGGSCNPTTWRKDIAIPALRKLGIGYFNPQTESEWTPQMLKMEEDYKMSSDVMLYVIDSKTRATASMVEAAFMAGASYPVILVMLESINGHVGHIGPLGQRETEELRSSKLLVTHLSKISGIPVFTNIETAIQYIAEMRTHDLTRDEYDEDLGLFKYPGSLISAVKKAYRSHALNNEFLIFNQIESSVRSVLVWDKNTSRLKLDASNLNLINDQCLSWNGYCSLIAEILLEAQVISRSIISTWGLSSFLPWNGIKCSQASVCIYGRLELLSNHLHFLNQLRSLGVIYYMYETQSRERHRQATSCRNMDNHSILLFNITSEELALQTMIQAAYDIGRGENIVLSVADVEQDSLVDGRKLSPRAVRDYNRGRAYLKDIASKHGIPVFNRLDDLIPYIRTSNKRYKPGQVLDNHIKDYGKT